MSLEGLFTAKTYESDVPLFAELGLKQFRGVGLYETVNVGRAEFGDDGHVDVSVTCVPAQFWHFALELRGRRYEIETGSGALRDYWPLVRRFAAGEKLDDDPEVAGLIADDMFEVRELAPADSRSSRRRRQRRA